MIGRNFGLVADPTVGGTPYDDLTPDAGSIPDPDTFWPLTNFNVEKGGGPLERNNEMRGVRGNAAPLSFRRAPEVSLQGNLYPGLLKKLALMITGGTDVPTGTAPAAITHTLEPVGFGPSGLVAAHLALYRDGLYEKIAGCQLGSLTLTFPNDNDATFEGTLLGLYRSASGDDYPSIPGFDDVDDDWVLVLRDAKVFLDGSASPVTGLRSFALTIDNQFRDPDFDAGQNVEEQVENSVPHRIWWPSRRRLSTAQAVTGSVEFSDVRVAEDRRLDLQHAQKIVFECATGVALGTTPEANEMIRITLHKTVYTGGGVGEATREDDIQTQFDYGAFIDPANGNRDVTFEFVDADGEAITLANA